MRDTRRLMDPLIRMIHNKRISSQIISYLLLHNSGLVDFIGLAERQN